jgi:uncharacterized protein (TIGR02391 family)
MPGIHQIVPDPEALLEMEPEEVALALLKDLTTPRSYGGSPSLKRGNYFISSNNPSQGYPQQYWSRVNEALMAAWCWLEREGFLLPAFDQQDRDWVVISARGRTMLTRENFDAYKYASKFPRNALHPAIAASTYSLFVRGHYDTVVFEAFREVEVSVRQACGYPNTLLGTDLMRKAFHVDSGPLTNPALVASERQAMSDLFAGSIGLFKNSTSHRTNTIGSPEDAISLVLLASYLLKLVDEQRARVSGRSNP